MIVSDAVVIQVGNKYVYKGPFDIGLTDKLTNASMYSFKEAQKIVETKLDVRSYLIIDIADVILGYYRGEL